jgi:ECF transporter S component (folate family)
MKQSRIAVRTMAYSALLIAMGVVLSMIKIPLSTITEITLTGLPIAVGGYLLGPWMGFVIGALIDVCGFLIAPKGAFFPGFTLSSGLVGLIYGLFLYRKYWEREAEAGSLLRSGKKGLVLRILLAHLIKTLGISLCLNCVWLAVFYSLDFSVVFFSSLPKEAVNFPIEVFLIYSLILAVKRIRPPEEEKRHDT